MQDPEHGPSQGPLKKKPAPDSACRASPSITADETLPLVETPEDCTSKIINTALRRVEVAGGRIEAEINGKNSITRFIFPDKEIVLTVTSVQDGVRKEIEVITKNVEQVKGPYQGNFHERGIDNKKRLLWPRRWDNAPPTRVIYDPKDRSMRIIFTNNPSIKIPRGWQIATVEEGNLRVNQTGKNEITTRISLASIFGNDKKRFKPQMIDFYGHNTFATMVPSNHEDIEEETLAQTS